MGLLGVQVRQWQVGRLALSSLVPLPPTVSSGGGASDSGCGGSGGDRLAVVASWDSSMSVVSLRHGNVLQELPAAHQDAISSLAVASHPHAPAHLFSGSWDGWVKVWATGLRLCVYLSYASMCLSIHLWGRGGGGCEVCAPEATVTHASRTAVDQCHTCLSERHAAAVEQGQEAVEQNPPHAALKGEACGLETPIERRRCGLAG